MTDEEFQAEYKRRIVAERRRLHEAFFSADLKPDDEEEYLSYLRGDDVVAPDAG